MNFEVGLIFAFVGFLKVFAINPVVFPVRKNERRKKRRVEVDPVFSETPQRWNDKSVN